MNAEFAITVIGVDRPGIIADTARVLAAQQLNLTDSSMTLLRGHFAMTLIGTGPAQQAVLEADLAVVLAPLVVRVATLPPEPPSEQVAQTALVTVHGADQLGIVAAVTGEIAAAGGNITDLTTRLTGQLYLLLAEVDLPETLSLSQLTAVVSAAGAKLGVATSVRELDREQL